MERGGRYRSRGGRASGRGGAATATGKGVFANGTWHCNCTPRLPAEHFRVKKEGPNKGRWFYTCQQRQPTGARGCDFFLWDEEAKLREESTVLANSRNEPQQEMQDGKPLPQGRGLFSGTSSRQPVCREDSETPSPEPELRPANVSKKRNLRDMIMDEGEDGQPWSLSGNEQKELADTAAVSSTLETPQKAQKTGVYATPATSGKKSSRTLPWLKEQEVMTPATAKKQTVNDYFISPSTAKVGHKAVSFEVISSPSEEATPLTPLPQAQEVPTPAAPLTPSPPSRHKDALVNPADSASSLTTEVLAELASIKLRPEKLASIRSILSKHDLKTQGVTKGRDISRLAVKARDAKIVQLESTIASLEAQRELDRSVIDQLKWKREHVGEEGEEESQL
ncbi:hypothetical protein DOTSEDRAFT_31087 [Dothistroma septosporum NZE10]|uniref:GRF-type domain-containing protein n=1 Tax=Dothistroma septosporum (strain NZE10 / CBS 128990) TaxID=675120 RepID=N1Q4W4_DOTSN|nr:hypothetical protein DOTSEDRAFT_31087 [Dothistroma septosporum NZE10]